MNTNHHNDLEIGDDLEITRTTRRASGARTWVIGTLNGHRFDALVFPEHTECPDFEWDDSRIRGTRHRNAHEAIQHLSVSGDDHAISVGGMYLSVKKAEAQRLEAAGVPLAYLFDRDGRIMTVPPSNQ